MAVQVKLFHPELGTTITVPESSAWVRLRNGWELVDEVDEAPTRAPRSSDTNYPNYPSPGVTSGGSNEAASKNEEGK